MEQGQEVNVFGRVLPIQRLHLLDDLVGHLLQQPRGVPQLVEEHELRPGLARILEMGDGRHHTRLALVAKPLKGERHIHAGKRLRPLAVLHAIHRTGLHPVRGLRRLETRMPAQPLRALMGQSPLAEIVAQRELQVHAAHATLAGPLRKGELLRLLRISHALDERRLAEDEPQLIHVSQHVTHLPIGENREIRGDNRHTRTTINHMFQRLAQPIGANIVKQLHSFHCREARRQSCEPE